VHLGKALNGFAGLEAKQEKSSAISEFERTVIYYRELIKQNPNNNDVADGLISALVDYGSFNLERKKAAKAAELFREAIAIFDSKAKSSQPPDQKAVILEQLAESYLQQSQNSKAIDLYRSSLEIREVLRQTKPNHSENIEKLNDVRRKLASMQNN
jgi:tetratricopeptide (TPR) repeat protein